MHKNTARNAQGRAVRAVLFSKSNTAGVDPATFSDERAELMARKRALEADIAEMKARITRAKDVAWRTGSYTNAKTYHTWTLQKVDKTREIHAIEARLSEIKDAQRSQSASADWTGDQYQRFYQGFHKMAKTMLADEVYDRVRVAAIHSMFEDDN